MCQQAVSADCGHGVVSTTKVGVKVEKIVAVEVGVGKNVSRRCLASPPQQVCGHCNIVWPGGEVCIIPTTAKYCGGFGAIVTSTVLCCAQFGEHCALL